MTVETILALIQLLKHPKSQYLVTSGYMTVRHTPLYTLDLMYYVLDGQMPTTKFFWVKSGTN